MKAAEFLIDARMLAPFLADGDRYHLSLTCCAARYAVYHSTLLRYPPCLENVATTDLRSLSLDCGVRIAEKLPALETLTLRGGHHDLSNLFRHCPLLLDLRLEAWVVPIEMPPRLPPRLRSLCISRCAGPIRLEIPEENRALVRVMCTDTRATLTGRTSSVRQLVMRAAGLGTPEALGVLSACPRLEHLDIGENAGVNMSAVLLRAPRRLTWLFADGNFASREEAVDAVSLLRVHPRVAPRLRLLSVWGVHTTSVHNNAPRIDMGHARRPLAVHGLGPIT